MREDESGSEADPGAETDSSVEADAGAETDSSREADVGSDPATGSDPSDTDELTHTTDDGDVQMVDVGDKPDTARRAVARGTIRLTPSTIEAIEADAIGKGDVLATARVGAVQAVKHTWETIPMCHQIPITNVETDFAVEPDRVVLTVAVETTGKTGCEMEALEGVTTGLNVVWDMVKAAEKTADGTYPDTGITDVEVLEKEKRAIE
ncbi:cyclic pyranopterin monophosphate synthase MoaC [Halopenitus persicus]|uniref:Probable cyclic pyranopterin monophosphate synthase n=1 Tax=Halopenitus persicus TaxID=1048396 RepID=A0A1H3JPZ1_9EURY|nr:cyclic pyranopterin monophosphate synthase MoaC [Halopenitus persicus]SDY42003.1 cyclic pyranopterin monophosphate synthase subunit MoaC [Halopenitus persicus]